MKKSRIYLDYASLTPIDPKVQAVIDVYSAVAYANPSSWYKEGVDAKKTLSQARRTTADFLHAHSDEIVFTSGGTESNNLAIFGSLKALSETGVKYSDMHVLASAIEHSSVMECLNELKQLGVKTELVSVDSNGLVKLDELKNKIRSNTVLVSIMTVNNEIGTIQPIREIAKIVRHARKRESRNWEPRAGNQELGGIADVSPGPQLRATGSMSPSGSKLRAPSFQLPLFHTDAAQAALYQDLNIEQSGVDLLTLDGSKVCGPRGIGCLFIRRHIKVSPIMYGGGQENGLRSGTENTPAIIGFAKALEIAGQAMDKESQRVGKLLDVFLAGLQKVRPDMQVNGCRTSALRSDLNISPHILSVSIPGIENEFFILQLDAKGIACSTKSSCLRDSDESYVLKAVGRDSNTAVRFSFGRFTTFADVNKAVKITSDFLKHNPMEQQ